MSSKKKLFAIIAAVAMLAGMLSFGAVPAFASSSNSSTWTPNVGPTYSGPLGSVVLNNITTGAAPTDQILLTYPSGVVISGTPAVSVPATIPNTQSVSNGVYLANNGVNVIADGSGNAVAQVAVTIDTVTGSNPGAGNTGYVAIPTTIATNGVSGAGSGPINVAVSDQTGYVTWGNVEIGNVVSGGTTATVLSTATIAQNSTGAVSIQIQENTPGAIHGTGDIHIDLPADFTWGTSPTINLAGGLTGATGWTYDSTNTTNGSGNSRLAFKVGTPSTGGIGTITITDTVTAQFNAPTGNIVASLGMASGVLGVTPASLTLGTTGTYNITASTASPGTVYIGKYQASVPTFQISEQVGGTLLSQRDVSLTLPTGVTWATAPVANTTTGSAQFGGGTITNGNETVTYPVTNTGTSATTIQFVNGQVNVSSTAALGPMTVSITGSGVSASTVPDTIAAPITATASATPTLSVGGQNQAVGNVTITEAAAGVITAETSWGSSGTTPDYLDLFAPPGTYFSASPNVSATVTSGNLVVAPTPVVTPGSISLAVTNGSTVASTIQISGINMSIQPSAAAGPVTLEVGGTSVVDPRLYTSSYSAYNATESSSYYVATDNVATISTVATQSTPTTTPTVSGGSANFTVGATVYSVNGVQYVMDVAPYISNGRTFVPVRYLGDALGATVSWDAATQTVTLTKGSNTETMNIGSTTMTVNGAAVTMDVAPVIVNSRTMLPARFVAQGLGAQVGWNPATQEVLITW